MTDPIIPTDEFATYGKELAPGVRLTITNVPMIVHRGGGRPDVRKYYTFATAEHLGHLRELGRVRAGSGETDIRLDFGDDGSEGRRLLYERQRALREKNRRRYELRLHAVSLPRGLFDPAA
jgi:hypothetical protein